MAAKKRDDFRARQTVPTEGRYTRISRRIWRDEKFRRLTPIPPCGQGLYMYLLTHPALLSIPGVLPVFPNALPAELHWDEESFRQSFRECLRESFLRVDEDAGLIWMPKAVYHNPPFNPNVVTNWGRSAWVEVPECALKQEIFDYLLAYMKERGRPFVESFRESFGEPLPHSVGQSDTDTDSYTDTDQIHADPVDPNLSGSGNQQRPPRARAREAQRDHIRKNHPDENFIDPVTDIQKLRYSPSDWLRSEADRLGLRAEGFDRALAEYRDRGDTDLAPQTVHDRRFRGWLETALKRQRNEERNGGNREDHRGTHRGDRAARADSEPGTGGGADRSGWKKLRPRTQKAVDETRAWLAEHGVADTAEGE